MTTEQRTLNNRSNKILKILKSQDLIKLECASTILSFILDEPDKKFIEENGFGKTLSEKRLTEVMDRYNTDIIKFIENMNKEYKIYKEPLYVNSIVEFSNNRKKFINFFVILINKLKIK